MVSYTFCTCASPFGKIPANSLRIPRWVDITTSVVDRLDRFRGCHCGWGAGSWVFIMPFWTNLIKVVEPVWEMFPSMNMYLFTSRCFLHLHASCTSLQLSCAQNKDLGLHKGFTASFFDPVKTLCKSLQNCFPIKDFSEIAVYLSLMLLSANSRPPHRRKVLCTACGSVRQRPVRLQPKQNPRPVSVP